MALLGAPGTGTEELAAALRQCIAPDAAEITAYALPPSDAALTLLMGLDLPCPPQERAAQEAADAQLRTTLHQSGAAYQVVYGQGAQRSTNALKAIKKIASSAYPVSAEGTFDPNPVRLRNWYCEKCSDPVCEHRLFTALTTGRVY